MPRPTQPGWIADRGELVRAYRQYTGLSQRAFAEQIGIKEQSLSDIEIGRRDTPVALLPVIENVIARFDDEVEQCIRTAETQVITAAEAQGLGHEAVAVNVRVTDKVGDEWMRAVIGRAAVTSDDLIVPILDGIHQREDRVG